MQNAPDIKVVSFGNFIIEASAQVRESLWFPEFQIAREGQVSIPWQHMECAGLPSEQAALEVAIERAMEDIRDGTNAIHHLPCN